MPVTLDTDAALQWLACTPATAAHCLDLLKSLPAEQMTAYEVSHLVITARSTRPNA
jgi:putative SOS response-associated peptidase YedK